MDNALFATTTKPVCSSSLPQLRANTHLQAGLAIQARGWVFESIPKFFDVQAGILP